MTLRLGVAAAVVEGRVVGGDVAIEEGTIEGVGLSPAGRGTALPGFVDAHINGFAGVDFLRDGEAAWGEAARALAATGVVAHQPTFVTASEEALVAGLRVAAGLGAGEGSRAIGVHLEGPFLSPRWPGAHDPALIRDPDAALAERLLAAGPVTTMTLAPERPGALQLIDLLVARGVVVWCGHSDADTAQAHAGFDRGARAITHLYNAHRRWKPREPGLGGVALARPDVTVQAIVDGVHLAPETSIAAARAAGERFALVTDAIEAAGRGEGSWELGDRTVHVRDGAARLADGTLAGSLATMAGSLRLLVEGGATLVEASHAASTAPAALLGRSDYGSLAPGSPAHVTVLDDRLEVARTVIGGAEAFVAA